METHFIIKPGWLIELDEGRARPDGRAAARLQVHGGQAGRASLRPAGSVESDVGAGHNFGATPEANIDSSADWLTFLVEALNLDRAVWGGVATEGK